MISTLFWTSVISLPFSAVLAYFHWQTLNWQQLGLICTSASLILIYNGLAVKAYKAAPAGQIALAEYSGLIFVTLIGIGWFDEIPDSITTLGIILIIAPLVPYREIIQRRKKVSSYLLRPNPPSERRKNITD